MTKMNATKAEAQLINNMTLNSFYQNEDNKKKMLKKTQIDKQRAHDLGDQRLGDAFFITKYTNKFNINPHLFKEG